MIIKQADKTPSNPVEAEGAKAARMHLLIHEAEGAPNFYMRQFDIAPGGQTPHHSHAWEHEIYVLAGTGVAVSGESQTPIAAGQCVFIPPNEMHCFVNDGKSLLKFLCLVPKV